MRVRISYSPHAGWLYLVKKSSAICKQPPCSFIYYHYLSLMHLSFTLLLALVCLSSYAQNNGLLLKDETGIYKHALDSTISTIQKEQPLRVLYIKAHECVLNYLPGTIKNVTIVTDKKKIKRKGHKLKPDELILSVACGQIHNDQVIVMITAPQPSKWMFVVGYEFNPENKVPKLLYVAKGSITVQ